MNKLDQRVTCKKCHHRQEISNSNLEIINKVALIKCKKCTAIFSL